MLIVFYPLPSLLSMLPTAAGPAEKQKTKKNKAAKVEGVKEKQAESKAESKESTRRLLSVAGLVDKDKDEQQARLTAAQAAKAAAEARVAADLKRIEEMTAKNVAARAALASAAMEAMSLKPESYSDSGYWEQRHAKSREGDETYEWYTGYPDDAMREVHPLVLRSKCHSSFTMLSQPPLCCNIYHVHSRVLFSLESPLWC